MRLRVLRIEYFGPFKLHEINFLDENSCILLTGKNNEGKSSIINALKFVSYATKVIGKSRQKIIINGSIYYKLLNQDTYDINIRRMIFNYVEKTARITAEFSDGFTITVFLDPFEDIVYAEFVGTIPSDLNDIFGFIPPLGPLAEKEEIIQKENWLKSNVNTTLAPRHFRNHLIRLLSNEEIELLKQIIASSWKGIELLDYDIDYSDNNRIDYFYKENGKRRELCWAGQGLQVWFQLMAHLVRLSDKDILILDEPEVNLHPEKQHELISVINDNFIGSVIIATHSVELMNNVAVSHILNIQKKQSHPQLKSTNDRRYLDIVRAHIGSNFNLIASQFEKCDLIIFTEDRFDYGIINNLAMKFNITRTTFNIPIHGFCEYRKCIHYKDAYNILIGKKDTLYTLLLDRDYYPEEYLLKIAAEMENNNIRMIFTSGKEIENIFLFNDMFKNIIPKGDYSKFAKDWNDITSGLYDDAFGSYYSLHEKFLDQKMDSKEIIKKYKPIFDKKWEDINERNGIIPGKDALKRLKHYYQTNYKINLSQKLLIDKLASIGGNKIRQFIKEVYQL